MDDDASGSISFFYLGDHAFAWFFFVNYQQSMKGGRIEKELYGHFRGEQLAIICCGPSFDRLDLEQFRGWHVWAVNATITALPVWMLASPHTYWFANHLDDIFANSFHREFAHRVDERYPRWRAIVHEHWMARYSGRMDVAYFYNGTSAEHPGPMGSVFCRALHTASRCSFREIVIAGSDMRRRTIPGVELRYTPHYIAPFDWKPAVPYRLKAQRDRISQWARRGFLSGAIRIHHTSDWPTGRGGCPFPRWTHREQKKRCRKAGDSPRDTRWKNGPGDPRIHRGHDH